MIIIEKKIKIMRLHRITKNSMDCTGNYGYARTYGNGRGKEKVLKDGYGQCNTKETWFMAILRAYD